MTERGRYRSITTALVNGPDYQQLTANARLVLLTMKISFGPSGIELKYPRVLVEELHEQTGLLQRSVNAALAELDAKKWIRRSGNVIWVVEQLRYEPQLHASNPKHTKAVRQHVQGLPRVALVDDFKRHYSSFFPETHPETEQKEAVQAIEGLSNGSRYPIPASIPTRDSLSHQGEGEGDGIPRRKPKKEVERKPAPPWVVEGIAFWVAHVGPITPKKFQGVLNQLVTTNDWDTVRRALEVYVSPDEGPAANGRDRKLEWFASDFHRWRAMADTPLEREGVLTERGRRLMARPA